MGSAALVYRRAIWMLMLAASLAGVLLSAAPARAESCASTASGAWDDPATFSCPGDADDIPDSGDAVTISGHVVSIPSGAPTFASLTVTGNSQLNFNGGGPMTVTGDLHMSNVSVVGSSNEQLVANGATYFQTDGAFVDFRNGGRITFNGPVTHSAGSLFIRSNGGPAPLVRVNSTYTFSGGIISEGIENTTLFYVAEGGSLLTTGTRSVGPAIEIDGFVHVQTGTLTLTSSAAAATHTGDIQVDGTSVQLGGGGGGWHFVADTLPDVTGIRGPGTLVSAAQQPVIIDHGVELMVAGVTIAGTGDFNLAGTGPIPTTTTVTHSAGTRLGSRGWIIGTLNLTGGGHIGSGTDTVTNLNKSGGTYDLRDGARLIVDGTATHTAGGLWVRDTGGGDPLLRINGTYNLDGGEIGEGTLANGPLVEITATGTLTSTSAGTHNVAPPTTNAGSVTVPAGHTFQFPQGLAQTAGTTTVAGTLVGTTTLAGGVLRGGGTTGTVVNNAGTVAPGQSPGTLTVTGNYTQGDNATLQVEMNGATQGTQFDHLSVTGTATLDGDVAIVQGNGFDPPVGDTFQFLTAGSRTGSFDGVVNAALPSGRSYALAYDPPSPVGARLTVTGPAAPTNQSPPSIPTSGQTGDTVTCEEGTWTGSPSFTYSWTRNGVTIAGQTNHVYQLTLLDVGYTIRCYVTGTNAGGSAGPVESNGLAASAKPGPPEIRINGVDQPEGNSEFDTTPFTFTVSLSSPAPPGGVSVNYQAHDGGRYEHVDPCTPYFLIGAADIASSFIDYEESVGQLTFAAGELSKPLTVPVRADLHKEHDEAFCVLLENASGGTIAISEGTGVIRDDDLPVLQILDARTAEGSSGTPKLTFELRYAWPVAEDISVDYATADGSANAPGDYTATSGTVQLSQSAISGTQGWSHFPGESDWRSRISVPVTADTTVESDETVLLNFSNASGVRIIDAQAVGTITNDDERLVLRAPIDRSQFLDRAVELRIACSDLCTAYASGSLLIARTTTVANAEVSAARRKWRLTPAKKRLAPGKAVGLRLKVPRAARRAGLRALRSGRKVNATVTVKATDSEGRSTKKRVRIRLAAPRR